MDIVEADDSITSHIGGFMFQIFGNGSRQRLDDSFMHDARYKTKSSTS